MNSLKKNLGLLWMLAGPALILALLYGAFSNIDLNGTREINNPVIWIIIIAIFLPIAIGLIIFGWYAWKGEYQKLPESSADIS